MNTRYIACLLALVTALTLPASAQNGKPDAEGFFRDWLILGPFLAGEEASGTDGIDQIKFDKEAQPEAAAGGKQVIDGFEFVWKKASASQFYIDFKEQFSTQEEHTVAWAVAYVISPNEKVGVALRMNSNDQGKVYLNGREVVKYSDARTLNKDDETSAAGQILKAGVNVVVLKVFNETNNWQGALRFMDKDGKPITDLKIETAKPAADPKAAPAKP